MVPRNALSKLAGGVTLMSLILIPTSLRGDPPELPGEITPFADGGLARGSQNVSGELSALINKVVQEKYGASPDYRSLAAKLASIWAAGTPPSRKNHLNAYRQTVEALHGANLPAEPFVRATFREFMSLQPDAGTVSEIARRLARSSEASSQFRVTQDFLNNVLMATQDKKLALAVFRQTRLAGGKPLVPKENPLASTYPPDGDSQTVDLAPILLKALRQVTDNHDLIATIRRRIGSQEFRTRERYFELYQGVLWDFGRQHEDLGKFLDLTYRDLMSWGLSPKQLVEVADQIRAAGQIRYVPRYLGSVFRDTVQNDGADLATAKELNRQIVRFEERNLVPPGAKASLTYPGDETKLPDVAPLLLAAAREAASWQDAALAEAVGKQFAGKAARDRASYFGLYNDLLKALKGHPVAMSQFLGSTLKEYLAWNPTDLQALSTFTVLKRAGETVLGRRFLDSAMAQTRDLQLTKALYQGLYGELPDLAHPATAEIYRSPSGQLPEPTEFLWSVTQSLTINERTRDLAHEALYPKEEEDGKLELEHRVGIPRAVTREWTDENLAEHKERRQRMRQELERDKARKNSELFEKYAELIRILGRRKVPLQGFLEATFDEFLKWDPTVGDVMSVYNVLRDPKLKAMFLGSVMRRVGTKPAWTALREHLEFLTTVGDESVMMTPDQLAKLNTPLLEHRRKPKCNWH